MKGKKVKLEQESIDVEKQNKKEIKSNTRELENT
jgi:hypothetical protein